MLTPVPRPRLRVPSSGGHAMPTDVAVIVAGFILVLVIFAGVLAWADHYSSGERKKTDR